jgi:AcrR family transcriptional regulator
MVGIMNESKEHILRTSLKLFLQKNFKEVTMKDLVESTGMSKGAIYHYFNSKEQVFEEVIKHFFMNMMDNTFSDIPQHSLKQFYTDVLAGMEERRKKAAKLINENKGETFKTNYYFLIFDAIKILPGFREELLISQKDEIKAWASRIKLAKESGEIKTSMTDTQLAKLFAYSGDGTGLNMIMEETNNKVNTELRSLWDGLYDAIKTPR